VAIVSQAGIAWRIAAVLVGASRSDERKIKNARRTPEFCPLCGGKIERAMVLVNGKPKAEPEETETETAADEPPF
jgi:hypothetical protein